MSGFKGYVELEDTFYFKFTSRRFSTGAPFTLAGTPSVAAYEDNSITEITAGLTLSVDFDSRTGLNQVTVVATAANGYEAGKRYEVVLTAGTVDSVSVVGEVVGSFVVGPVPANVTEIEGVDPTNQIRDAVVDDATRIDASALNTAASAVGSNGSGLTEAGGTGDHLTAIPDLAGVTTLLSRLSAARAGYLDNLNIGENVAGTSEVTSIQNNTRCVRVVPQVMERPDSGTTTYRIELFLYDDAGNMEAPDSAPTAALVDQDGNDLSSRLDAAAGTLVSTGRYRWIYTNTSTDELEQLLWAFSVVEGGNTRLYGNTSVIVDTTAVDFTAADRTKLDTLHDTRITAARMGVLDDLLNGGRLDLILDQILADTGTDGVVLSSATQQAIADALLDRANGIETGFTPRQALRIIAAAVAGILSGAATTTNTLKALDKTTTRISATVDASGNRSAISYTPG